MLPLFNWCYLFKKHEENGIHSFFHYSVARQLGDLFLNFFGLKWVMSSSMNDLLQLGIKGRNKQIKYIWRTIRQVCFGYSGDTRILGGLRAKQTLHMKWNISVCECQLFGVNFMMFTKYRWWLDFINSFRNRIFCIEVSPSSLLLLRRGQPNLVHSNQLPGV